jgi:hypothetical protein
MGIIAEQGYENVKKQINQKENFDICWSCSEKSLLSVFSFNFLKEPGSQASLGLNWQQCFKDLATLFQGTLNTVSSRHKCVDTFSK